MANGNPVRPDDKLETKQNQTKKPYVKPAFRFERVFETQALSCGKVLGQSSQCNTNSKFS
jgi:hypothetical protein